MSDSFPSIEAVLSFLRAAGGRSRKRDVAEAFHLRGEDKQRMKELLRTLRREGRLEKTDGKRLNPVALRPERPQRAAFGIFRRTEQGGVLYAVDRRDGFPFAVEPGGVLPDDGAAVSIASMYMPRFGPAVVRLGEVLPFNTETPFLMSEITLHEYGLPKTFPPEVEAAAAAAPFPTLHEHEDLRDIPFAVIDPADARDHDDAVWAEADGTGMRLHVAIADVSFYVRPGTVLDAEARRRGNSVYLTDRAVPMLPERLSAELCSLLPDKDRAAVVVTMQIGPDGEIVGTPRVRRGLIRAARLLSYEEAETAPGLDPLWAVHRLLEAERERRNPLALESTEYTLRLTPEGRVRSAEPRARLESHKLIENCMIAANVAVARLLAAAGTCVPYRVHDVPPSDKVRLLRESVQRASLQLAKAEPMTPAMFNQLLASAADTPFADVLQNEVLRTQTQASYDTLNIGHFGLALECYLHFTSPIRRYADLCVHRALLRLLRLERSPAAGPDDIGALCRHLNLSERKANEAERACRARYSASFYSDRIGEGFEGFVTGVGPGGAFLRLRDTGAEGFLPLSELPGFLFDDKRGGRLSCGSVRIAPGELVAVRLKSVVPPSGTIRFAAEGLPTHAGSGRKPKRKGEKTRTSRKTAS